MKNIGGLNQFSAAANLTLSQHFLEKKKKIKNCPFILFNNLCSNRNAVEQDYITTQHCVNQCVKHVEVEMYVCIYILYILVHHGLLAAPSNIVSKLYFKLNMHFLEHNFSKIL